MTKGSGSDDTGGAATRTFQLRRWQRLIPPRGLPRLLCGQTLLWSLGAGSFLAGNIVFFTQYAGLTAGQVSLGLSLAAATGMLANVPLGQLADRVGAQRTWAWAGALEAGLYLLYPWVHSVIAFAFLACTLSIASNAGGAARTSYTFGVLTGEVRIRTLAFVRSTLNIGFTVGAGLTGIFLAIDNKQALLGLPLVTATIFLVNAWFIARLPSMERSASDDEPKPRINPFRSKALRDGRFVGLSLLNGGLMSLETLLNVTFPLWILTSTDAPREIVAALFIMNAVLATLLQVPASKGAETPMGSARLARRAGYVVALSCLVIATSSGTTAWSTITVLTFAYFLLTAGELWHSASDWGIFGRFSPQEHRAEYQSVWTLGIQVARLSAISGYTALIHHGTVGWICIAAIFMAVGLTIRQVVSALANGDDAARPDPGATSLAEGNREP